MADSVHLTCHGTSTLARNIKEACNKALGLPTASVPNNTRRPTQSYMYFSQLYHQQSPGQGSGNYWQPTGTPHQQPRFGDRGITATTWKIATMTPRPTKQQLSNMTHIKVQLSTIMRYEQNLKKGTCSIRGDVSVGVEAHGHVNPKYFVPCKYWYL